MSFSITEWCVGCWACHDLCPNQAIEVKNSRFWIIPELCRECEEDFPEAQCAAICPAEEAIVDRFGNPLNPFGSLTGVPQSVRFSAQESPLQTAPECR